MAGGRRWPWRLGALLVVVAVFALGWAAGRFGIGRGVPRASLTELERQFTDQMRSATLAWSRGTSIVQPRSVSSWSSLRSSNTNLSRSAALKDELLAHRLKYGVEQPGEYIQPIERIKSDKFFDGNG